MIERGRFEICRLLMYKLLRQRPSNSEHDPGCGENPHGVDGGSYVVLEIPVCMGFFDFVALGGFSHDQETDL